VGLSFVVVSFDGVAGPTALTWDMLMTNSIQAWRLGGQEEGGAAMRLIQSGFLLLVYHSPRRS
jgi:hypothetical protein